MPVPINVNHCYGGKPPVGQRAEAEKLFRQGLAYRNALAQLEYDRRKAFAELLYERAPELRAIQDEIDKWKEVKQKAEDALNLKRQLARTKVRDKELSATIKGANKEMKKLIDPFKARKQEVTEQTNLTADQARLKAAHLENQRKARKESQLPWGTYHLIEAAAGSFSSGPPPRLNIHYQGEGRVAVHVQGDPLLWHDLVAGKRNSYIQLDPPDPAYRPTWHRLILNLGSVKKPLWMTFHVKLHRTNPRTKAKHRIPLGTRVTWIVVHKRMVAGKEDWRVQVCFNNATGMREGNPGAAGDLGIDIGFRKLPANATHGAGIRVAYWIDEDGKSDELRIPQDRWDQAEKAASIRSHRQLLQNVLQECLLEFKQSAAPQPDWWKEATERLGTWKKANRYAWLARKVREQLHLPGDSQYGPTPAFPIRDMSPERMREDWQRSPQGMSDVMQLLTAWDRRDRHLWRYEQGIRRHFVHWRRWYYRQWAFEIAQRYSLVKFEKINLQELIAVPPVGTEDEMCTTLRRWQGQAALGELRGYMQQRADHDGLVDPKWTTQACHKCRHMDHFDAAKELVHTCSNCGEVWDQDHNGAINILNGPLLPPKEKKPPKPPRGRKKKAPQVETPAEPASETGPEQATAAA